MAYTPTNWQDGVTPVNAANLNKLEQGLAAAVGIPADVVVTPTTALLIRNRLTAGDANPVYRLNADGKQEWGAGGASTPDVNLSRGFGGSGGGLEVSGWFWTKGFLGTERPIYREALASTEIAMEFYLNPWPGADNFKMLVDGKMSWGPGTAPLDTFLFRTGPNWLGTGALEADQLFSYGPIEAYNSPLLSSRLTPTELSLAFYTTGSGVDRFTISNEGSMRWGDGAVAPDTSLARSAANSLYTPGNFAVGTVLTAQWIYTSLGTFFINSSGMLEWGPGDWSRDTNLYRYAVDILATDGQIYLRGTDSYLAFQAPPDTHARFFINPFGTLNWGSGTALQDVNLYRQGADSLKTDDNFEASGQGIFGGNLEIRSFSGAASGAVGIYFTGLANDGSGYIMVARRQSDPNWRFMLGSLGQLSWGDGTAAPDVSLYRQGAGHLRTNGALEVNQLIFTTDGSSATSIAGIADVQGGGRLAKQAPIIGDCNTALDNGWYMTIPTTLNTVGSGIYGFMRVERPSDTHCHQWQYTYGAPLTSSPIWYRHWNGTTWSAWTQFVALSTKQYPLKLTAPRSQSLQGNAFWTVKTLTMFDFAHWEFVKDVEGRIGGQILIPSTVSAAPNAKIVLVLAGEAANGVSRMNVAYLTQGTTGGWFGGTLTPVGAQDVTMPGAPTEMVKATFALSTGINPGTIMFFEIIHEGAHANDTFTANTWLVEAYLEVDS